MKKNVIFFLFFMFINPALAANDDALLSLFEGTAAAEKETKEEIKNKNEEDKGFFSFFNFGQAKKSIADATQNKLSTLEQTIKLADEGDVSAQLLLGYSYLYGTNNAPVDYDKSFNYYAKAALQNDPVGLNNLGSLYYSGIGTARNTAKAAILFEKAAELGNPEAAVNLAFILISGNGRPKNPQTAMKFFQQAAEAKNPTAQFMVGYAHYRGKLLTQDYFKAVPLIKAAADAGFDEAQIVMSQIYIKGFGVPQNYANAVKYLQKASFQGDGKSMMSLGEIVAEGQKYEKDTLTAHIWFNLAAVRGIRGAAEKRDAIEKKLKMDQVLLAQSRAEKFSPKISELTDYIRKTFGENIRNYVDDAF